MKIIREPEFAARNQLSAPGKGQVPEISQSLPAPARNGGRGTPMAWAKERSSSASRTSMESSNRTQYEAALRNALRIRIDDRANLPIEALSSLAATVAA